MTKKESTSWGSWAFIIGVLLAIVAGLISSWRSNDVVIAILILLGLIVGFMNVTAKETTPFLMAALALVIVAWAGGTVFDKIAEIAIGEYIVGVLNSMITFVIPATIVVALKAIYALAKDE